MRPLHNFILRFYDLSYKTSIKYLSSFDNIFNKYVRDLLKSDGIQEITIGE